MTAGAAREHRASGVEGLRALAALGVLVYHAWLYTLPRVSSTARDSTLDDVLHELRLGLVLFFVLSGYLLVGPWVRSALDGTRAPRVRAYALRRVARIVPAYWLAIVGSIVLLYPIDGEPGVRLPPAGDLWRYPLFLENFWASTLLKLDPPMWTLAVEWCFYLVLPLLGFLLLRARGHGRAALCVVPFAFGVLGVLYNHRLAQEPAADAFVLSKQLPATATYFAAGMLAAILAHGRRPGPRTVALLVGAGLVLVVGGSWLSVQAAASPERELWPRIWRDTVPAVGFALVVAAVATADRPLRLLARRPLAWTGRVSFGIYLWHVPLLVWLRAWGVLPDGWAAATVVVLGPTLLVAAASWYLLERPVQAAARRRTGAAPPTPVSASAAAPG